MAKDRTRLANERTFLAYIRTFLAFLVTGVGIIKLTEEKIYFVIGLLFIGCSMVLLLSGFISFIRTKMKLRD
jgi:putative membrane protein